MEGHAYTFKWNLAQLYIYAWPFIHCLYFIYARKICVRTHEKITRHWKSTPREDSRPKRVCTEPAEQGKVFRVLGLNHGICCGLILFLV